MLQKIKKKNAVYFLLSIHQRILKQSISVSTIYIKLERFLKHSALPLQEENYI